jgi:Putative prokaryotic signal transducing protein
MDLNEQTTVYRASSPIQASLIRNLLESEGIRVFVGNQSIESVVGAAPAGWASSATIIVRSVDEARARTLIEDFEFRLKKTPSEGEDFGTPQERFSDEAIWPRCPKCSSPRFAVCPRCQTFGLDFEKAELTQADGSGGVISDHSFAPNQETSGNVDPRANEMVGSIASENMASPTGFDALRNQADEYRLMCTVCDQSFIPQYLRECQNCDHEFPQGVVLGHAPAADLNARVVFVVILVLCLFGLGFLYLAMQQN